MGPIPSEMPLPDGATRYAVEMYLDRVRDIYPGSEALLFGSRARGVHRPDSDADLLIVLRGPTRPRFQIAAELAAMAFDVLQETGIFVDPLPVWEAELADPISFTNPALIESIRRDGVQM